MKSKHTRREFGAYTVGLGLGGSLMSSLSSGVRAAETGYETDAAGVPRPADANELDSALSNVPEHSLVECRPGTVYRPGSTLEVPRWVTLDATGAVIEPQHGGDAVQLEDWAEMYGGTINMGDSDGIGVLNDAQGNNVKWKTGCYGTHITANPGSGTVGHKVMISGDGRNFYHSPVLSTAGVDFPLEINNDGARSGSFITSINAHLVASDFVTAIRGYGPPERNMSHCFTRCDLTPGPRTKTALEYDNNRGRRFCAEGNVGDASKYDQLLWIKQTKDNRVGQHVLLSYDGYSSRRNPGLIRNDTDANDCYVIDFS